MPLLDEDVTSQLKEAFAELKDPVRLAVFSQALADPESEEVRKLIEEVVALDPRLSIDAVNFVLEKEKAEALGIARTPAVAVLGQEKDYGIRFYGMPAGYEFGSLVDTVLLVSNGDSGLKPETRSALAKLEHPAHIQVFSTPT